MQTKEQFAEVPVADIVCLILDEGERADEAMYYLLQHRLYLPLKRRYEIFQHLLHDDFDDVLEDFFLYLRDGNDSTDRDEHSDGVEQPDVNHRAARDQGCSEPSGNVHHTCYSSLRRIRNPEAFVQWLLRTFRNYLITRTDREGPFSSNELNPDCVSDADVPISILTDEDKLAYASDLLAYAHQELSPREGFILFRSLLSTLDKRQSLPNEDMAEALGMTDVTYRVTVHRVKDRLARYRTRLLQGESLRLDEPHRQMSRRINEDFLHLYPTLLYYYTQSINTLAPDNAAAVNRLRQSHLDSTGDLLHEPTAPYARSYSKAALWHLMEGFL